MLTLNVIKRTEKDTIASLKKDGKIPAVFYGPKEKSASVAISLADFIKIWKKAGESSVISLKDGSDEHEVLIHDVDRHPVTESPRHVDFYVLEKGKKVQIAIPIVFEGVSPAVKEKGAILVKVMRELKIEAAPKDLPREIKVDIAPLIDISSTISAKDIVLPSGVSLITNGDDIVASISEAKEEVEEAPTAIDMSAIEVEKKGKEVKEGEGEEAGGASAPKKEEAKK